MKKCPIVCRPEDVKKAFMTMFANNSIIPIVGAGFSCGLPAKNGTIPSGCQFKAHMIDALKQKSGLSEDEINSIQNQPFSNICDYYEDNEFVPEILRTNYLKANFSNARFGNDIRSKFFDVEWPYIYSLNIDDAIENSSKYTHLILPSRNYREEVFVENHCLIKLHGDIKDIVTYKSSTKVFSSQEYAISIDKNIQMKNKMRNDFANQNILFLGCSLDDELDLKLLNSISVNYSEKETLSNSYIFVKGSVGRLDVSKYKQYGITHIVCFETFEGMYTFLSNTWEESKKIPTGLIGNFTGFGILYLDASQTRENQDYFLWGTNPVESQRKRIIFPFYFTARQLTSDVFSNLSLNKVHLIQGGHMSGKTYVLADLYRTIRDRAVYIFDGKTRLTDEALESLVLKEDIVAVFDVGSLNRNQFETLLLSAKTIHDRRSNYIIAINRSDSDFLGIVKWRYSKGYISSDDILEYQLDSRIKNYPDVKELDSINERLPVVTLPIYVQNRTILDQLIGTESEMKKGGRFSDIHIVNPSIKLLALLIILAVKEKVYSSDVVIFSLEAEMFEALEKYTSFIEKVETQRYEKSLSDLSSIKYVLNSKLWLQRELGQFVNQGTTTQTVLDAYSYIISKVIEFYSNDDVTKRYRCRDFILFDVMNEVFLNATGGNIYLIVKIYERLHTLLATDMNFIHQEAKCQLNYSYTKKDKAEKLQALQKAHELSLVAQSMAQALYDKTGNDRITISLSHIQYTLSTVLCQICVVSDYCDLRTVEEAIDVLNLSLQSPYNLDDYKRDMHQRSSRGIKMFVKNALAISELEISREAKHRLNHIINNRVY